MRDALVIVERGPHGTVFPVEAFRLASGLAAMDIETRVVLLGDAVYCLHRDQDTTGIGMPPITASLDIMATAGVSLAVVSDDLARLGVGREDLLPHEGLQFISPAELAAMVAGAGCSFRF